jgi:hypothetical protein
MAGSSSLEDGGGALRFLELMGCLAMDDAPAGGDTTAGDGGVIVEAGGCYLFLR